jgi:hypothetical protein
MRKNLTKKAECAVQENTLSNGPQRGLEEGANREDMIIPRAKILQPTSPEITGTDRNTSFHTGEIINSLTKDILPETFIPIFKFTHWVRFNARKRDEKGWNPDYGPGKMIWKTNDPDDPRVETEGQWGRFEDNIWVVDPVNGGPPLATKFMNFFSMFPGCPMPVIVSFCKTSYPAGKTLLSLCAFSGGDIFKRKYKLKTIMKENDQGTFFVYHVEPDGMASEQEFKQSEQWYEQFSGVKDNIVVHDTDEDELVSESEIDDDRPY